MKNLILGSLLSLISLISLTAGAAVKVTPTNQCVYYGTETTVKRIYGVSPAYLVLLTTDGAALHISSSVAKHAGVTLDQLSTLIERDKVNLSVRCLMGSSETEMLAIIYK